MNLSGWSDEDRAALTRFYGSGNAWTWNDMEQGEDAAALFTRGWIEASNPPKNTPILLPRHVPESNTTYWYALAFNEPPKQSH